MSSRQVTLSAAFLTLAAGGTAACDAASHNDQDFSRSPYSDDGESYGGDLDSEDTGFSGSTSGGSSSDDSSSDDSSSGDSGSDEVDADESGYDEVFYCADEDGEIVDEDYCDDDAAASTYFFWHSPEFDRGLTPGTRLDGGDYFPAGDRKARRSFKLPPTGKVGNGTVKTNVVGRGSGSSDSGSSGG